MPEKPLRIGIIGANYTLIAHGHAWRVLPGVEIGAICTAHQETAEAAAREYGIDNAYWDYRKLYAESCHGLSSQGSPHRNLAV